MTTSPRKRPLQPGHRVTSLELPTPVWQALKIRAAMEGRSLRAVLLAAVERYLATEPADHVVPADIIHGPAPKGDAE